MQVNQNQLEHATEVLAEVLRFEQPADALISSYFRLERALGHRDRGVIAETVYAVLRNLRHLEVWCGDRVTARRLVVAAQVRVFGLSSRNLEGAVSAGELAWIAERREAAKSEEQNLSLGARADLPDWLADKLAARLG